jgi:hypothetical protein
MSDGYVDLEIHFLGWFFVVWLVFGLILLETVGI